MAPNRLRTATASDPHLTPPALAAWLSVFRSCFTAPVWNRVLVLVAGAVLAPGKRTVTQALRVMGLGEAPQFRRYHEVLGRARWTHVPWRDGCWCTCWIACCPAVQW